MLRVVSNAHFFRGQCTMTINLSTTLFTPKIHQLSADEIKMDYKNTLETNKNII